MRLIFVNVPTYLKKIIFLVSLLFKDTFFFNLTNPESSSYLHNKNVKPINFEDSAFKNIEKYIFGINSGLEKHLCSFFFSDLEKKLKFYFKENYLKKAIYLTLHQKIIPLSNYTGKLKIWLETKKRKKNYVFFFDSNFFFSPPLDKNSKKIIIPLNLISLKFIIAFFKRPIFKFNKNLNAVIIKKNKNQYKPILYIINKSFFYGSGKYKLFKKDILLENQSKIKKYLDVFVAGGENKINIPIQKKIIFFYQSIFFFKTSFLRIKSFKNLICLLFFIKNIYLEKIFHEIFKHKNYKCCYVDYDILMPSYIYWALKRLNIKVFSYQERFNLGFSTKRIAVFCDHYFVNNPYQIKHLSKSSFITAKTFQQVGQVKSEFINNLRLKVKKKKKTITIFGFDVPKNKYYAFHDPLMNWKNQKNFLQDILKISNQFKKYNFIIRFKSLTWLIDNRYFDNEVKEINKTKNIIISNEYSHAKAYKICANSSLIISRWSSIMDEAYCAGIPVIMYNYYGLSKNIIKKYFDYGNNINSNNLDELIFLIKKKISNNNIKKLDNNFSKKLYGKVNNNKNYTKNIIRNELYSFINK